MPQLRIFSRSLGSFAVAAVILTLGSVGAQAASAATSISVSNSTSSSVSTPAATTSSSSSISLSATCTAPALTQPFLPFGDSNEYALPPGESFDNFSGSGWTLSGGAKLVTTKLQDGTTGSVLDLPSGATAVSPAVCVTNEYPTARTMVRNVTGSAGVNLSVIYPAVSTKPVNAGTITGSGTQWSLPAALNISPSSVSGWQLAQFTLTASGSSSEYQLYNLYLDPRMSR
jgi:hypothetical protein